MSGHRETGTVDAEECEVIRQADLLAEIEQGPLDLAEGRRRGAEGVQEVEEAAFSKFLLVGTGDLDRAVGIKEQGVTRFEMIFGLHVRGILEEAEGGAGPLETFCSSVGAQQERRWMPGADVADKPGGGTEVEADGSGEVTVGTGKTVETLIELGEKRGRGFEVATAFFPERAQLHGIECGGDAVAHDIGDHDGVCVRGGALDAVEVAANEFFRGVGDLETNPGIGLEPGFENVVLYDFGAVEILHHRGEVTEHLDAAECVARGVMQRGDGDFDRDAMPALVLGEDQERLAAEFAGDDGAVEGAQVLAAELVTVLVHVDEDIISAAMADDLGCGPAGNALGGTAPEDDLPVTVRDVGAVGKGVEDLPDTNLVESGLAEFSAHK